MFKKKKNQKILTSTIKINAKNGENMKSKKWAKSFKKMQKSPKKCQNSNKKNAIKIRKSKKKMHF